MRKEKACGIIVYQEIDGQTKFLVIKHNIKEREDYWNFPKGHVEAGESEEETAIREVFEETGISTEIVSGFRATDQYFTIDWDKEKIDKNVVFFVGKPLNVNIKIDPAEVIEAKWLNYAQAKEIISYDGSKRVLEEAAEFIEKITNE